MIGDEAVGKTSIVTRFMYDTFDLSYKVTIGIDFVSKNLYLEDRIVRLQLWYGWSAWKETRIYHRNIRKR